MNLKKIGIFLLVVFIVAALLFIMKKQSSIYYYYDVSKDYIYDFNQTTTKIDNLNLKDGVITLSKDYDINQTMFLKVDITASFMSMVFQPSIKTISQKSSTIQYVEHRAKGIRYINISSLVSKKGDKIKLVGKYIDIPNQTIELVSFKNKTIKNPTILILAPHPDDAEIAAFGLYSKNSKSYIITITAGDAGEYMYDEIYSNKVKHYLKKGEIRTFNSITVPLLGGIPPKQAINLGFFDGTLKKMYQNKSYAVEGLYTKTSDIDTFRKQNLSIVSKGLSGDSSWNSLVSNLKYLLKTIKPDIIVTPYPKLDSHSDHKYASIALFEAIKSLNIKKGELYLYSNHYSLSEYYPYGDKGAMDSLPPQIDNIYFDKIISYTLSSDMQKDKIFALEAMNDLRQDTQWSLIPPFVRQVKIFLGIDKSYYRRAIRNNELFFVINIDSIYDEKVFNSLIE